MFYHWLYPLHDRIAGFGVFQYVTVRSVMALFTALLVYWLFGQRMIAGLARLQCWQTVRDDGPASHVRTKGKTPTMGGLLIGVAVGIAMLLWSRWDHWQVWLVWAMGMGFGLIGFYDDYRKLVLRDANGLRARYKFPLQMVVALAGAVILFVGAQFDTHMAVPFLKHIALQLGVTGYVILGTLVIVGTANAVNLTDGLDGLVTGPSILAFSTYGIFAYLVGHATIAQYLQIPFMSGIGLETGIVGASELTVLCAAVVGSLIGFLWYNAHPAMIFMGDVGSLPLGAMLGTVALLTKQELLLVIIGGIFVLETVSVIVQVISFKLTGKRVFRMAPLHHHFELKGWPESRVIIRFWIIALVLALIGLTTLKIR